jgi:hypothetical protein
MTYKRGENHVTQEKKAFSFDLGGIVTAGLFWKISV